MEVVLQARNLRCSYQGQKNLALEVGEFTLHKGCIHFVLGRSGIGKSTLIEALGLMEQTVHGDSNCSVKLYRGDDVFDILDAWSNGPSGLSEFRQKHFSFIFQSTNLLPNLSLAENVLMPAWIAGVNDDDELHSELSGMFERLLKEIPKTDWDKDVTAISGGQRQRLAFMRALMAPYTILFGDEPTGNLDAWKADQAMALLSSELKAKSGTACIVSHDIPLALKYADSIHLLTPSRDTSAEMIHGELRAENEFIRSKSGWTSRTGVTLNEHELQQRLNEALVES